MQRDIGAIEIVGSRRIDHDPRQRAAAAGAVDHLLAGRRRGDVVFGADQQQRRHPRAPAGAGRNAAVRIERDRGAIVRLQRARGELRPHHPQHGAGAIGPADQADAVVRHPGLLGQPLPRRGDVGDTLAARQHTALLDAALRAEFARAVAVRQQHRMPGLDELLRPVAVARLHGFRIGGEPAAAMQGDHQRKRAATLGLIELRMQRGAASGNLDLLRRRRGVRGAGDRKPCQECGC